MLAPVEKSPDGHMFDQTHPAQHDDLWLTAATRCSSWFILQHPAVETQQHWECWSLSMNHARIMREMVLVCKHE